MSSCLLSRTAAHQVVTECPRIDRDASLSGQAQRFCIAFGGRVDVPVHIHVRKDVLTDKGVIDLTKFKPVARLGDIPNDGSRIIMK
ncbi:hypothetical protein BDR05DRAFT_967958 [Suillus weaverae]|nr:hypothetical protein BDR05DRAFT_967958 [Suillus weaverae]